MSEGKNIKSNKISQCKICGHSYDDFYPWGEDGKVPSFEICDCCGVTFGYEDATEKAIKKYRESWLQSKSKERG